MTRAELPACSKKRLGNATPFTLAPFGLRISLHAVPLFVLRRFGLLALIAMLWIVMLFTTLPITSSLTDWTSTPTFWPVSPRHPSLFSDFMPGWHPEKSGTPESAGAS